MNEIQTQTSTEERRCEDRWKKEVHWSVITAQEGLGLSEAERGQRNTLLQGLEKKHCLEDTFILDFWPPEQ